MPFSVSMNMIVFKMTAHPKLKLHCSTTVNSVYLSGVFFFFFFLKQRSDSRLVMSFVTHRLLRRGSLPVCPPPHAQWDGIRLHEAAGPSGDAEQVAFARKN